MTNLRDEISKYRYVLLYAWLKRDSSILIEDEEWSNTLEELQIAKEKMLKNRHAYQVDDIYELVPVLPVEMEAVDGRKIQV